MIEELAKGINWGDISVMGGLVFLAWILRPVLMKWVDNVADGIKVQRDISIALVDLRLKIDTDTAITAGQIETNRELTANVRTLNAYVTQTDQRMTAVTEARIGWQKTLSSEVGSVITRLDKQQSDIDHIAKQITTAITENDLRHEVSKLLLIVTEMGRNVKNLIPAPEPSGEAINDPAAPEVSETPVSEEGKV